MAANAEISDARQLRDHLVAHHWTKREARAFIGRYADLIGQASYDDWEDLSVEWLEAGE